MKTYRLVRINNGELHTLRLSEASNSQTAIQNLVDWANSNGWKPALEEQDVNNPVFDCWIERFNELSEDESCN